MLVLGSGDMHCPPASRGQHNMPAWPHPDAFQCMHQAAGQDIQHAKRSFDFTDQSQLLHCCIGWELAFVPL